LRRELIAILSNRERQAIDPTRGLFVRAWVKLLPTLQQLAEEQSDQQQALQFLTFISAGDVLQALDELGPGTGIDISADGLRRLARILIPSEIDPLLQDDAVDPELRRSLGFGPPVPPPQASINRSWLDWFIPSAVAATSVDPAVVKRLNNWVPKQEEMNTYLPMVRDVLRSVVAEHLRTSTLDGNFRQVYRSLVFSAAWQESCWRQFMVQNKMRVPMQSSTGDLGIMQINPGVWRGLYDLHGLRWDIAYNARSGADILEHHMINYAIKQREHLTTGSMDNLARSAYAAYNGGPKQFDRYRRKNASERDKKVDGLFFDKYRQVKSGKELGVKACYGI
ncbi:MAG: lytic transglycosylase domain-containing protein, partial [Proteobacteria bacterium]|nr:lytic transglycosylase domain-containing protein [Pseudomonadota bacterium]